MSYAIEAIERLKKQGKIRFAGFGCHFTHDKYFEAFAKYGGAFDICSVPYNVRHRAAEEVIPAAKKAGLGMVTIKPFARGELLKDRDPAGAGAGLARDMVGEQAGRRVHLRRAHRGPREGELQRLLDEAHARGTPTAQQACRLGRLPRASLAGGRVEGRPAQVPGLNGRGVDD
jgi:aryl-alcohol dehydrogenase-like predicted oxidoreductase